MLDSDLGAFSEAWSGAWELCGRNVTPAAIMLAFEALRRYELGAVMAGLTRHALDPDRGQFPPKPADIVRHVEGGTEDRALLAWSKVDRAMRSVGPYQTVAFDDPVIHAVLWDMGGWIKIGEKTDDDWPFVAKEFQNRYRGYASRGLVSRYPAMLVGIVDAKNRAIAGGSGPHFVALIGDQPAARHVMDSGQIDCAPEIGAMSTPMIDLHPEAT